MQISESMFPVTVVSDHTAILAYLDNPAQRWNATEKLGVPVFVSYSFLETGELPSTGALAYAADAVTSMSEAQRSAVRSAMAQFEAVTGVTFVETDGPAMIEAHGVIGSNWGGWATYPFVTDHSSSQGTYVIDVSDGDAIWGYDVETLLHEVGHAVGLSHTHEGNLTLASHVDIRTQSIMSYEFASYPSPKLGPLDIEALQVLYGDPVAMEGWTYGFRNNAFRVRAGDGDDLVFGVEGRNVIAGGNGDDRLIGRDGDDKLMGGNGNDVLKGMSGADTLQGGRGNDRLYASVQDDLNYFDVESQKLIGGQGRDRLFGGDGADRMSGGNGKDRLDGGFGNDMLIGGKGLDKLTGGSGNDTFQFRPKSDGARDVVTDFVYYSDQIAFRGFDVEAQDIRLIEARGGSSALFKIKMDDGPAFKILFRDTDVGDMQSYLDYYHDFG